MKIKRNKKNEINLVAICVGEVFCLKERLYIKIRDGNFSSNSFCLDTNTIEDIQYTTFVEHKPNCTLTVDD